MMFVLMSSSFVCADMLTADAIRKIALRLYPNDGDAQNRYMQSEKVNKNKFNQFPSSESLPNKLLDHLRENLIREYPASMARRLSGLTGQVKAHHNLKQGYWAEGLPEVAKAKILAVGEILWSGDYTRQYRRAISEAQAYRRLQKVPFDHSGAAKKYPNSYLSQLYEAMGIRLL